MRAFVIGNGASLNQTPLDKLRDEFTIGMNRFNLLGLDWSPDWWVMADVQHGDDWWDWGDLLWRDSMFLFRERDRSIIEPYGRDNAIFMERCAHIGGKHTPSEWHLPQPCEFGGSISAGLQTAAELGHDPIYLLGCDLYKYRGPDDVDINHFDPGYCSYRTWRGKEWNPPEAWERLNNNLIRAHEIAKGSADSMGITIYNATVGGKLEVYERVDINTVLNGKE